LKVFGSETDFQNEIKRVQQERAEEMQKLWNELQQYKLNDQTSVIISNECALGYLEIL